MIEQISEYFDVCKILEMSSCCIKNGDGDKDHASWDRPESINTTRPAYKVDSTKPGSDVAGEYAAAMTVGYLLFKDKGMVTLLIQYAQ